MSGRSAFSSKKRMTSQAVVSRSTVCTLFSPPFLSLISVKYPYAVQWLFECIGSTDLHGRPSPVLAACQKHLCGIQCAWRKENSWHIWSHVAYLCLRFIENDWKSLVYLSILCLFYQHSELAKYIADCGSTNRRIGQNADLCQVSVKQVHFNHVCRWILCREGKSLPLHNGRLSITATYAKRTGLE